MIDACVFLPYHAEQAAEKVARRLHRSSKFNMKSCASTPCGVTQAIPLALTQPISTASADSRPGRKTVTPLPSGLSGKKGPSVQFRADVEIINSTAEQATDLPESRGVHSPSAVMSTRNETWAGKESRGARVQMPWLERAASCCSQSMSSQSQGPQCIPAESQISGPQDAWCTCEPKKSMEKALGGVCRGPSGAVVREEDPKTSDVYSTEAGLGSCNTKDAGHTPFLGQAMGRATPQEAGTIWDSHIIHTTMSHKNVITTVSIRL